MISKAKLSGGTSEDAYEKFLVIIPPIEKQQPMEEI